MWRYNNDNGRSSAYRSLHINTSRDTMAYSDFPLPKDWVPFPDHELILKYFESYVDHFGFRDTITFRTRVEKIEPVGNGEWDVTVVGPDGEPRTNRYGVVRVHLLAVKFAGIRHRARIPVMPVGDQHRSVTIRQSLAVGTDDGHVPFAVADRFDLLDARAKCDRVAEAKVVDVALEVFQDMLMTGERHPVFRQREIGKGHRVARRVDVQ